MERLQAARGVIRAPIEFINKICQQNLQQEPIDLEPLRRMLVFDPKSRQINN